MIYNMNVVSSIAVWSGQHGPSDPGNHTRENCSEPGFWDVLASFLARFTTILCAAAALIFRLNPPAIQLVNYGVLSLAAVLFVAIHPLG